MSSPPGLHDGQHPPATPARENTEAETEGSKERYVASHAPWIWVVRKRRSERDVVLAPRNRYPREVMGRRIRRIPSRPPATILEPRLAGRRGRSKDRNGESRQTITGRPPSFNGHRQETILFRGARDGFRPFDSDGVGLEEDGGHSQEGYDAWCGSDAQVFRVGEGWGEVEATFGGRG